MSSIQRLIISKLHSHLFQLLNSFVLALLLEYILFTEIFLICIKFITISIVVLLLVFIVMVVTQLLNLGHIVKLPKLSSLTIKQL